MGRIIFLLEEESMAALLRGVMKNIHPEWMENEHWVPIAHRGKSDLEKSIPRKLRAWREPGAKFVILRDNDGGDCIKLKAHLRSLAQTENSEGVLIRIVCQELESWLLGDLDAIRAGYPSIGLPQGANPAKYRSPDDLTNASQEIQTLTRDIRKVTRTTKIAFHMNPARNRSRSFQALIMGLNRIIN
jgi:hypothetical protein